MHGYTTCSLYGSIAYLIEYSKPMGIVIRVKFNFINYYNTWLMETKTISNPNRKVKESVGRIYLHTFSQRGSLGFTVLSNAARRHTGLSPGLYGQLFFHKFRNKLPPFASSTLVIRKQKCLLILPSLQPLNIHWGTSARSFIEIRDGACLHT